MRKVGMLMDEVQLRNLELKIEYRKRILPEFARDFLTSLELDKSPRTQLEYAKDIQLFFEYLIEEEVVDKNHIRELTLKDLKKVTDNDIQNFMNYLTKYKKEFLSVGGNKTIQEFTNGPKGKERKRVSVHGLYNYLIEKNLINKNPTENIRIKVEKFTRKPLLSDQELNRMLDVALFENPHRYRAVRNFNIIKILAFTGIQISELVNLNIDDIWQERNEMVVVRKDGEEESIYLDKKIRYDLYSYLNMRKEIKNVKKGHKNALFLSQRMRRMDPKSVRKMIRKVAGEAGVNIHVTPQTFRRTFGWKHYNEHGDIELTTGVLGNRTTETTRYNYAIVGSKHTRSY